MAKKALVHAGAGNRICDVRDAVNVFPVAAGLSWVDCPDACTTKWAYDGATFSAPDAFPPTKALKFSALEAKYDAVLHTGFSSGSKTYDLRGPQRPTLLMYYTKALAVLSGAASETWPADFTYPANDGSETTISTANGFRNGFIQVAEFVKTADKNYRVLRVAIANAGSISAVNAVNVNAGWP